MLHEPGGAPNGGTWLGYTLGVVGLFIILLLLWYGIRKRQYLSNRGQVKSWLSAHVYLGTLLLPIVTLHSGFQFNWNIHTLAYVLMVLVVASGFFGIYTYVRYPELMTANLGNLKRKEMLTEIRLLDHESLSLSNELDPKVHEITLIGIRKTRIGGTVWQHLTRNTMDTGPLVYLVKQLNRVCLNAFANIFSPIKIDESDEIRTVSVMADVLASATDAKIIETMNELILLVNRREDLVKRVVKDIQYKALMEIWLYLHIPLSIGLLAALFIHIVVVFFYW
jgi:hypothetical protein